MSKKSKSKKIILEIVKEFFNKRNSEISIPKKLIPTLDKYIKETSMDGIAYLIFKNKQDIPKEFLENLKERFKILKQSYNDSKQVFDKIKQLPFKKILFKENTFKYTNKQYKKGSRYSCDIDIFVPEMNIFNTYKILQKNSFYTNALDININNKIDKLGFVTNKDIQKYPTLKQAKENIIQEQLYKEENYNPLNPLKELRKGLEQQINTLKNIVELYKKLETGDFYINKEVKKIINSLSQNTKQLIQSNGEKDLIDQKKLLIAENKFLEILKEEKNNNLSGVIIILEETLSWLRKGLQKNLYTEELKNYSENLTNIFNQHINKIIKLRQIINKDQKLHSFYKNGTYVDLHFNKNIFYNKNLVNININNLNQTKLSKNLYSLAPEDSIIIDACHFTLNLSKYNRPNAFQGFLKYITDLLYKIKFNNIDWKKIVNIAKKTQSSSQVWFYLKIAKKYLKVDIPQKILKQLKKDSYKGQIILLSLIPKKSLLFNKSNVFIKLYSKSYLENGLINKFVQKIHHIYNNFSL